MAHRCTVDLLLTVCVLLSTLCLYCREEKVQPFVVVVVVVVAAIIHTMYITFPNQLYYIIIICDPLCINHPFTANSSLEKISSKVCVVT